MFPPALLVNVVLTTKTLIFTQQITQLKMETKANVTLLGLMVDFVFVSFERIFQDV